MFKKSVDAIRPEAASQTCEKAFYFPSATAVGEKGSGGGGNGGERLQYPCLTKFPQKSGNQSGRGEKS
jgi:hypothetical protein